MAPFAAGYRTRAIAAGLVAAELPRVEHVHPCSGAPVHPARDREIGPRAGARHAHRHVLPPCLVAGGATLSHLILAFLPCTAYRSGVVVVHLLVVPCHEPRRARVRRLERGVGLVLRVAATVVVERAALEPRVAPHASRAVLSGVLVDV